MSGKPLPKATVAKITDLHNQNCSLLEISRRTGVSYNGVRRHVDPGWHERANAHARKSYYVPREHSEHCDKVSLARLAKAFDDND